MVVPKVVVLVVPEHATIMLGKPLFPEAVAIGVEIDEHGLHAKAALQ